MFQEISTGGAEGKTGGSPDGEGPGDVVNTPVASASSVFSSV